MAIHAHSTTAPGFQRRLLRAARLLASAPAERTQTPALTAETVAMLDAMPGAIEALAAPGSTARQHCSFSDLRPEEALASTAPNALLPPPAPLPSMTSALSRRRAIFGAVALAAVPVALSPAQAADPAPTMSVEAVELQAELETTSARHRAALKRCSEADAAIIWPAIPETLFRQPIDVALFPFTRPGREPRTKRLWWGFPGDLEALQARQLAYFDGSPIRDARARRDEIVAAHAEHQVARAAAELAAGLPSAEAEYEEAAGAFYDVTDRLIAMRTDDPAIMGLKALAMVDIARPQGGHDKLLEQLIADESNQAVCLGASLLRDFIGQHGAAHREAAHV